MKKMYFVFIVLIIVIFSFDFSFADGKLLTLPISPKTFIDAGVPANSKLFVFQGPCFGFHDSYLTFQEDVSVTFYTFYKPGDNGYDDYTMSYNHSSYEKDNKVIQYTFCNRFPNSFPAFINGNEMEPSTGGITIKGHITPSVYYFDGENVKLIEGEDVGFPGEFFHKGDETIRFEVPKNQSVVFSINQIVSLTLSNLKFKWQFFTIGQNWEKRLKDSNYDVRFFINGKLVTDYESSVVYSKVPSANVLEMSFRQNFKDGEKYVLKAELFKNGESIAWHKIDVICQTSFVDKNGDGYDDNTGVKIPNGKGSIDSLSGFFDFIFSFFASLFEALKRLTFSLREFVVASSNFSKVLVSIFSANPVVASIFSLSLTIAVFLRIMKR